MQAVPCELSEQSVCDEEKGEDEIRQMRWRRFDLVPHAPWCLCQFLKISVRIVNVRPGPSTGVCARGMMEE